MPLTKWEYYITPLPLHTPGAILGGLGAQGWELVQVIVNDQGGTVAYLKRPVEDAAGGARGEEQQ